MRDCSCPVLCIYRTSPATPPSLPPHPPLSPLSLSHLCAFLPPSLSHAHPRHSSFLSPHPLAATFPVPHSSFSACPASTLCLIPTLLAPVFSLLLLPCPHRPCPSFSLHSLPFLLRTHLLLPLLVLLLILPPLPVLRHSPCFIPSLPAPQSPSHPGFIPSQCRFYSHGDP